MILDTQSNKEKSLAVLECQLDPKMGDFGGDDSLDGLIVGVRRRFKLFWILHGQGYKLGPPGGLADHIRNAKKTPGWAILEETTVQG